MKTFLHQAQSCYPASGAAGVGLAELTLHCDILIPVLRWLGSAVLRSQCLILP